MFSATSASIDWNAMPVQHPSRSKTGPPELPELMAASICTPRSSRDPWTYDVDSIRLTTPEVTEIVSPPMG